MAFKLLILNNIIKYYINFYKININKFFFIVIKNIVFYSWKIIYYCTSFFLNSNISNINYDKKLYVNSNNCIQKTINYRLCPINKIYNSK